MSVWNARVRVFSASGGGDYNPETGDYTAGEPRVLYEGRASVQDNLSRSQRLKSGDQQVDADLFAFLPSHADFAALDEGQSLQVTAGAYKGERGTIEGTQRLDRQLLVKTQ